MVEKAPSVKVLLKIIVSTPTGSDISTTYAPLYVPLMVAQERSAAMVTAPFETGKSAFT
jgi:hypothetical protein